jgi:hypothetical protein
MRLLRPVGPAALFFAALLSADLATAAEQNRSYLYSRFENGDIPTGQDFKDLIDSALNLTDDGLASYRVGVAGSTGAALRLNPGAVVGPALDYAPVSTHPLLAPLWLGQFGFLPMEFQDAGGASHYGYFQLQMAAGPQPPPPGSPGPEIFVEYLVWQTDANVPLVTTPVPEPATLVLASLGALALLRCRCTRLK